MTAQRQLEVVSAGAAALLDPMRRRILELVRDEADSATGIAKRLGLPRQRVNYHVRELEKARLLSEVGTRQRRGLTERLVRASASHYLISPGAGSGGVDPDSLRDRFSAAYQVAVAARTVREVGRLMELAEEAGRPLPTLTVDTEVRFATPRERDAFADELLAAVTSLAAKYHHPGAGDGRTYRLSIAAHPVYRADADTTSGPA